MSGPAWPLTHVWLAQQDDLLGRIVQLVAIAIFLGGPLLVQLLRRLLGGAPKPGAAPRRPERGARTPSGRTPAEEDGRDLWRQLMELEEAEEAGESATGRSGSPRAPADPLADPDVELAQPRPRPPRPSAPAAPERREPVFEGRSSESDPPVTRSVVAEPPRDLRGLEPVLAPVPSEDALETAVALEVQTLAGLERAAPPAQLAQLARVGGAPARPTTRAELRRALVLGELLAPPVALRPAGRGGHDPLA
jgi:hypothetical protein